MCPREAQRAGWARGLEEAGLSVPEEGGPQTGVGQVSRQRLYLRLWGASGVLSTGGLWKAAWDRSPPTLLRSRRGTGSASGSCTTWSCSAAWPWPAAPSFCTRPPSCRTSGGQPGLCPPPLPWPHPSQFCGCPSSLPLTLGSCRLLLLNQFHDVVTGSCIQLVAEEAMCHYEGEVDALPAAAPDARGGAQSVSCGDLGVIPNPQPTREQPVSRQISVPTAARCSAPQPQPCAPGSRGPRASSSSTRCLGRALKCWPCPGLGGPTA